MDVYEQYVTLCESFKKIFNNIEKDFKKLPDSSFKKTLNDVYWDIVWILINYDRIKANEPNESDKYIN